MAKGPTKKAAALAYKMERGAERSAIGPLPTKKAAASAGRIMYFECKAGAGFKSNYYEVNSGENYWISGPKRAGGDALYGGSIPIEIDEDVREEYWRVIRRRPGSAHARVA